MFIDFEEDLKAVRRALQGCATSPQKEQHSSAETPAPRKLSTKLDNFCQEFQLSTFERKIILLCLGMEIYDDFPTLCAQIHPSQFPYPTLNLATAVFSEDVNLRTLTLNTPLQDWYLLEIEKCSPLQDARLSISKRILQYLLGVNSIDERLTPYLKSIPLVLNSIPSQETLAERIVNHWQKLLQQTQDSTFPGLHLSAEYCSHPQGITSSACKSFGRSALYQINACALPKEPREWHCFWRLLMREAMLNDCTYLVHYDSVIDQDLLLQQNLMQLAQSLPVHCILAGTEIPSWFSSPIFNIHLEGITPQEQCQLWLQALKNKVSDTLKIEDLETLVQNFNLNSQQIQQTAFLPEPVTRRALWKHCRQQCRQSLNGLAQIIEPKADWNAIVLSNSQMQTLRTLIEQIRHRHQVYQQWGFSEKYRLGLGVCALFSGPSGTGKTLAAEIIAHELQVDLYQIDLSNVTNKYLGETEKHLKKLFDSAEKAGALLLFDEADALFGKRTEVKEGRDRYANLSVNYLLQRIESYRGLSILTTNLKNALDDAFMRRIRFIVPFPFPDKNQRAQIWSAAFPEATPTQDLAIDKLANLNLAGGHIRNIAVNAAFLAAKSRQAVTMQHVLNATRAEYLKLEQSLPEATIRDWIVLPPSSGEDL